MSASSRIILWQLWRLTRAEIFWVILGQYAFLGLLLLVAQARMASMFHLLMPVFFIMMFFAAVPTVVFSSLRAAESNPRNPMPFPLHLDYVQPVRTFTLVFLSMAYSCIKAATVYLAVAIPITFGLGEPLPLLPFAYWLVVMAAVLQAAVWTPATTGGRAWGYVLGVGGVGVSFIMHVCVGQGGIDNLLESDEPLRGLFEFTPAGYLGLGLLALGALAVAVASVERQRHGECLLPSLRTRTDAPASLRRRTARRFAGPVRAQVWCEVRRALIPPLLFPLIATSLIVLVSVLTTPFPDDTEPDLMAALWLLLVAGTFLTTYLLTGHLSGALRFRGGGWSYSTFEATLPLGTGTLALIKVGTVLAGGALATTLLAAGTAIAILPHLGQDRWVEAMHELIRECSKEWGSLSVFERFALVYVPALWALSAPLLLFSFGEAAVAYPRRFNVIVFLCAADVCLAGLLLVLGYPLHLYGLVNAWVLGMLVAGGTVWAVYRALERRHVDRRLFIACATLWAISAGIWCVMAAQSKLPLSSAMIGFQIALLFAPLLAVVAPPLALAANRHR